MQFTAKTHVTTLESLEIDSGVGSTFSKSLQASYVLACSKKSEYGYEGVVCQNSRKGRRKRNVSDRPEYMAFPTKVAISPILSMWIALLEVRNWASSIKGLKLKLFISLIPSLWRKNIGRFTASMFSMSSFCRIQGVIENKMKGIRWLLIRSGTIVGSFEIRGIKSWITSE
ncbi:hypothetical protein HWI79_254 [Cryptosporidium felis]|nr:hypothetical protein HWI79_254 [Cryptosporidium felis]